MIFSLTRWSTFSFLFCIVLLKSVSVDLVAYPLRSVGLGLQNYGVVCVFTMVIECYQLQV